MSHGQDFIDSTSFSNLSGVGKMIQAASLAMGSSIYYSDYSISYNLSIISSILLIIGGVLVTFRGLNMMYLTYFIATLTALSTIFELFTAGILPSIIAIVIALLIACIRSMYQVGLFFVGMTMSIMIILVIYMLVGVVLVSPYSSTVDHVVISATMATILSLVIGLCMGACLWRRNSTYIKHATCIVGGFRASNSTMILIALTIYRPSETALVVIYVVGGVVLTAIGGYVQNVEDLKLPGTFEESPVMGVTPVAIPVTESGLYVNEVEINIMQSRNP